MVTPGGRLLLPICLLPSFWAALTRRSFASESLLALSVSSPFSSFLQSVLNVISELQEQMCSLQLDIHRQIQERLSLRRGVPDEVAPEDGTAEPPACSQDCAYWEGSPVGTTPKYISMCVRAFHRGRGWGFS